MPYNFKSVEKKWQKVWKVKQLYRAKNREEGKKNFYHLVMFPYPSGDLHVGHWRNFAPADVYARFKRLQGFNVFSPIGFDAFGLPAENAAIKHGIHPEKWTLQNIKVMTKQLESMGNSYDWSKLIITCLPEYYKWNQLFFLRLFKRGLAYRKKAPANWCTSCKTVLANEQVIDNKCERCGNDVVQKEIDQWLFRITAYAERLFNDLERLDWPGRTKMMQKNWIGRSEGVLFKFPVVDLDLGIEIFTTRSDTIRGATYIVLAPEHELIQKLKARIKNWQPVWQYIEEAKAKTEKGRIEEGREKTGIELIGLYVINPATKKEIPVWTSDYVVGSYGTGAIMAVPAHDERDREFAEKFGLPISDEPLVEPEEAVYLANGKRAVKYKLRDWLISRQRYWGTPIPIIYCKRCGVLPVPEEDLPVKLPPLRDFKPAADGRSPLARHAEFLKVLCPQCKGSAWRETDTMDTFVDSSWYFLRYPSTKYKKGPFEQEATESWLPVNMYIGGAEHALLHLLYARFFTKFLKDEGLIDFSKKTSSTSTHGDEPFLALRHQGTMLGPDSQKMSKSRGNVIDPDALVREFGADAVRLYLCFIGDFSQTVTWDPQGILGVARFLNRVHNLALKFGNRKSEIRGKSADVKGIRRRREDDEELTHLLHKTIKKVGENIEAMKFNTAVSALMVLLNEAEKQESLSIEFLDNFIRLLAPFAPHLSEELYQLCIRHHVSRKHSRSVAKRTSATKRRFISVHTSEWPKYSQKHLRDNTFILVIQVNGRLRGTLTLSTDLTRDEIETKALESEAVKGYLGGEKPVRVVYVPQKLVNVVTKSK